MKRIILTVTNDLSSDQRMHRIAASLSKGGYEVTLVGRRLPESKAFEPSTFKAKRLNLFFSKGKLFYAEYNFRLLIFLLFQPFDIVCAIDADTLLPCLFASSLRGKKRVFDAHELFPEVPELVGRGREKKIWEKIENFAIPEYHACYSVSPGVARLYQERTGKSFGVIRNCPVLKKDTLREKKAEPKIILYQGALNMGRGLEELISAMTDINARLWIAGEGDLSIKLREMAKKSDAREKITFLGRLEPEELRSITAKAWLGYNLLEDKGLSYRYSLANKFFDYIHAGIPSLSPPFPEYQAINDEYPVAKLIEVERDKIAVAINLLLEDSTLYQTLSDNCIKAREVFNWQNEEGELLNIYRDLE